MDMNKFTKLASIVLVSSALLSGCIKETLPEGGGATQGQIQDSPFAQDGVVMSIPTILITNYIGIGDHFDFGYPGIFGATDRLAGEVFPTSQNMPGGNAYTDRWQCYLYPGYSGLESTGYGAPFFYNNYYQFIYAANDAIKLAADDESKKELRGIAKAFRALYYLDLARLYDPLPAKAPARPVYETEVQAVAGLTVPIVREDMELSELENNPRAPRDEMFRFIFEDLNDAEACLSDYTPATKNLPSLAVVYGLKARAYLWLGGFEEQYTDVPTGDEAYRQAAQYARKAIEASSCTPLTEAQWLDPLTGFNTVNAAWMWAMIQSTDTVLNNLLSWTAHMSPEAMWGYGYLAQPGISLLSFERIHSADFRRKTFVDPTISDRAVLYASMKSRTTLTEEEFATIAPCASFKFHPNGGEKSNFSAGNVTSIPLMRVEEMYLIEAEATAHYDAGTGRSLIESFMSSYRAPGYKVSAADDLVDEILFQKRIELWGEGQILYDMKRLNVSLHNGDSRSNAPEDDRFTTEGRAPWWNCVIPLGAVQQNVALSGKNNPNPVATVRSNNRK